MDKDQVESDWIVPQNAVVDLGDLKDDLLPDPESGLQPLDDDMSDAD